MCKTGLIHHLFNKIATNKPAGIYLDLALGHPYYLRAVCNQLFGAFRGIINQDPEARTFESI